MHGGVVSDRTDGNMIKGSDREKRETDDEQSGDGAAIKSDAQRGCA